MAAKNGQGKGAGAGGGREMVANGVESTNGLAEIFLAPNLAVDRG